MSRAEKCRVSGCPGVIEFATNGNGAVNGECPCCQKRAAWKAKHLPDVVRLTCAICTGQYPVSGRVRRSDHCPACNKLVKSKQQKEYKARMKAEKSSVRALRSA